MPTLTDLPQRPLSCSVHRPISSTVATPCTLHLPSGICIPLVPGQCVNCQIAAQLKEPEPEFSATHEHKRDFRSPTSQFLDAGLSALEAITSSARSSIGAVWAAAASLARGKRVDGGGRR